MGATAAVHPADPILQSFGLGKLDDVSSASVSKHLEGCDSCQRRVAELSSDDFPGRLQNAQIKPDRATSGWSPSCASSIEGTPGSFVPPAPVDTLPPELVDHADYEIVRELGRGGMGVVYLAQNKLMGRPEVLKVIGRHLVERPGVLDRFLREVRSAAKLQHANIVTAYSAMRLGQSIVLAMEYIDGLDLAKMVKTRGPLPIAHACYFIHQAALGLQHAHERGMVHRDIKPANLILARDGKKAIVKVLDFGLAKVTSEGQADSGLTREGQMLGTPDYIAPEQIRDAQSADIRADIYSLGCTFYYLLTGGPPFRGEHLWDLYQAHFSMEAGPLNLLRPEVPAELNAVVAKMMAKEPDRRFQVPVEVAEALTPFFKKGSESTRAPKAEVSLLGQKVSRSESPGRGSMPTQPGTNVTSDPAQPVKKPAEMKFDKTEQATGPAPVVGGPERRMLRWIWPAVAAATLMLGFVIAWGVIHWGTTPNGVITSGEEVTVPAGGKEAFTVRIARPSSLPEEHPKDHGAESSLAANKDSRPDPGPVVKRPPYQESIPNSIGMTLKLVSSSEFTMGSAKDDPDALPEEKPPHPVRISPFYVGIHEVTQEQYQEVMGINPSYFSSTGGGKNQVAGRSTDHYPVEYVTWLDAVRFCNILSEREGFAPFYEVNGENVENVEIPNKRGPGYRLPTEAEWEYACRAGTSTRFSFGDDRLVLSDYGWFDQNSVGMTHPVGEKQPNAFGLRDMHGNVSEWCSDGYDENFYKNSPKDDPLKSSGTAARVNRGGSWRNWARQCWTASRAGWTPMGRSPNLGFRVALNPSGNIKNLVESARTRSPSSRESNTGQLTNQAKAGAALTQESKPGLPGAEPKPALRPGVDWMSPATRMAFNLVKSGEFMMGSSEDDEIAASLEKPPHKVRVSPFYLGIYEVTQGQYTAVLGNNPSFFCSTGGGKDQVAGQSTDQYPVENVSWLDAVRFCNALSKKDRLTPYYQLNGDKVESQNTKGAGYRLPTDAEWEYACRAGTNTRFYFGNDSWILGKYGWFGGSSGGISHPVGQKRPNDLGLYDMHGNVWEWCSDWADGAYYKQSPVNDPPGAAKGTLRVLRGGCWKDEPRICRSANVNWWEPAGRYDSIGFRVARGQTAAELTAKPLAQPAADTTGGATATAAKAAATAPSSKPPHVLAPVSPEEQLKARGLTRSGSYFVVASESEAIEKYRQVRPLIDPMARAYGKYLQVLQNQMSLVEAEEIRDQIKVDLDMANVVLSKLPNGAKDNSLQKEQYAMGRANVDGLNRDLQEAQGAVDLLRGQQVADGVREDLRKDYNTKRSDFLKAADELAKLIDKAKDDYRKVESDPVVKAALAALHRSNRAAPNLSTTRNLQNELDTIKKAVRIYSLETNAPKKRPRRRSAKSGK